MRSPAGCPAVARRTARRCRAAERPDRDLRDNRHEQCEQCAKRAVGLDGKQPTHEDGREDHEHRETARDPTLISATSISIRSCVRNGERAILRACLSPRARSIRDLFDSGSSRRRVTYALTRSATVSPRPSSMNMETPSSSPAPSADRCRDDGASRCSSAVSPLNPSGSDAEVSRGRGDRQRYRLPGDRALCAEAVLIHVSGQADPVALELAAGRPQPCVDELTSRRRRPCRSGTRRCPAASRCHPPCAGPR